MNPMDQSQGRTAKITKHRQNSIILRWVPGAQLCTMGDVTTLFPFVEPQLQKMTEYHYVSKFCPTKCQVIDLSYISCLLLVSLQSPSSLSVYSLKSNCCSKCCQTRKLFINYKCQQGHSCVCSFVHIYILIKSSIQHTINNSTPPNHNLHYYSHHHTNLQSHTLPTNKNSITHTTVSINPLLLGLRAIWHAAIIRVFFKILHPIVANWFQNWSHQCTLQPIFKKNYKIQLCFSYTSCDEIIKRH